MYRLQRVSLSFAVLLIATIAFGETSLAQVSVRGYTRKDGTYVRPHHRSYPDGNFYNNWSTKGNVNPYTGEPGTKVSPPSGYGRSTIYPPSGPSQFGNDGSFGLSVPIVNPYVERTEVRGYSPARSGTPAQPDSLPVARGDLRDDSDARSEHEERWRILQAEILERLGHNVDWRDHSHAELVDMVERIHLAHALARMGHRVDWEAHSYMDMIDMACRIRAANELRKLGFAVNWQDYTHAQLLQYRLEPHQSRSAR